MTAAYNLPFSTTLGLSNPNKILQGFIFRETGMQTSLYFTGRWEHKVIGVKPTCRLSRLFSVRGGWVDLKVKRRRGLIPRRLLRKAVKIK